MRYPDWARQFLVDIHRRVVAEGPINSIDWIDNLESQPEFWELKREEWEKKRLRVQRSMLLPDDEDTALLERLITKPGMRHAWAELCPVFKSDTDYFMLWLFCSRTMQRWRGDPKLTRKAWRGKFRSPVIAP